MRALAAIRAVVESVWLPVQRARLNLSGQTRLARALDGRTCPIAGQIEKLRAEMLADRSVLADGSLGPMAFDTGLSVADACDVSRRASSANVLYSLASEYGSKSIIELGTNVGISSAYLAAAGGHVTTLDASPYRLRQAKRIHGLLGLNIDHVQGLFDDTLKDALERMAPVDMAFIDGHHQYQPTLDYFDAIAAKAAPGCVFLFDDIRWSRGMAKAWGLLRKDPRFQTVADLGAMGIGVLRLTDS
jgi:predicted O-methyltransferase YrrM